MEASANFRKSNKIPDNGKLFRELKNAHLYIVKKRLGYRGLEEILDAADGRKDPSGGKNAKLWVISSQAPKSVVPLGEHEGTKSSRMARIWRRFRD